MDISLNNQFLQSFNLSSKQEANRLLLGLPVYKVCWMAKRCLYSGAETGRDQPAALRL
ncbi:hypothetical protein ACVXHA_28465 [Escherichia coli]